MKNVMQLTIKNYAVPNPTDSNQFLLEPISAQFSLSGLYLVTGNSGFGKTLLGRSIADLLPLNLEFTGEISSDKNKNKIRYAPQFATDFFIDHESILSNLNVIAAESFFLSDTEKTSLLGYFKLFGLEEISDKLSFPVKSLSAGMKYRLMLLCLIMKNPEFLIIDEPFASLDEKTSSDILNILLDQYEKTKMGMMIISHIIPENLPETFERIHLEKSLV